METIEYYYKRLKKDDLKKWNALNAELARMNEIDYFKRFVLKEQPSELLRKRFSVIYLVVSSIPEIDLQMIFDAADLPLPVLS